MESIAQLGKSPIYFKTMCTNQRTIIVNKEEVTVKCGQCDTCRKERAQEWAIKLINESNYHKKACFITLTFDNKILLDKNSKAAKYGANASFVFNINNSKEYFKKFIKRLRKKFSDKSITFYHVGEYGEKTKRPHHHAIIYGINFEEDRFEMEKSKSGKTQYFSKTLSELWACGRTSIQDINKANTIYICQYSLKKFKNNELNKRYKSIMSFSNRSKISTKWVRRNKEEIIKGYIKDADGKKYRVPKSYINNLKNSNIKKDQEIYAKYEENIMDRILNNSNRELVEQQRIKEEQMRIRNNLFNKSRDF